jgi:hypothetical protein
MVGISAVAGCVVTDTVEFHEPVNSPPVFLPAEQSSELQLGEIVFLDKNGGEPGWKFTFRVRDADIEQELRANWRILRNVINLNQSPQVNEQREMTDVPLSGTDTRTFDIDVNPGQLAYDNCHRIEIAVSGSFRDPFPGQPFLDLDSDDRADLAQFSFWVWEGEPTAAAAAKLVDTCAARVYQPAVPSGVVGAAGAAAEGTP